MMVGLHSTALYSTPRLVRNRDAPTGYRAKDAGGTPSASVDGRTGTNPGERVAAFAAPLTKKLPQMAPSEASYGFVPGLVRRDAKLHVESEDLVLMNEE
jgi:hypothetical protein